jgi:hypothetical protein
MFRWASAQPEKSLPALDSAFVPSRTRAAQTQDSCNQLPSSRVVARTDRAG